MQKGDVRLTPLVNFVDTKANIEAFPSPVEGMTAQQTDSPYAQGRYANGAWVWGGGGTTDHEALTGLLGGSANNHYHLTPSQVTGLVSGTSTGLHLHTGTYLTPANIEDSIADGVTDKAPSENAVYDALALKVPTSVLIDSKDPTGWLDPDAAAAALTYDSTNQKIMLTGTHSYYWQGEKYSVTNFLSDAHTDTVGHQYYLSSTDGVNFTWATDTIWTFDVIMLSVVNYQTAYKYASAETHGLMQWQVHEELHRAIGTFKESGGTLDPASYTLASTVAANRRPNVVATHIHDEDIDHVLAALTSKTYQKFSLSGASTVNFSGLTAEIVSVTGAKPNYNLFTSPNWGQAAMANNTYMCVWLVAQPVTQDANSQTYRYMWVQGQSAGTLASQQALTPADLYFGTLTDESSEFVVLVKVIINYVGPATNDWRITSVTNISGTRFSQVGQAAGAFLSTVTTDATLTGDGSLTSPLVVVNAPPATTALSDFIAGNGSGAWAKKTLAETQTILGLGTAAYVSTGTFAPVAKGVTNGDTHDHVGGDGAQIDYIGLANLPALGTAAYVSTGTFALAGTVVDSVTGDGVNNTDPANPVLTFANVIDGGDATTY